MIERSRPRTGTGRLHFSLPQSVRRPFAITMIVSFIVFPLTFGTLIGHYRDQNDPKMEEIFYQLHYNVVAVLQTILVKVTAGTTIRFQKQQPRSSRHRLPSRARLRRSFLVLVRIFFRKIVKVFISLDSGDAICDGFRDFLFM